MNIGSISTPSKINSSTNPKVVLECFLENMTNIMYIVYQFFSSPPLLNTLTSLVGRSRNMPYQYAILNMKMLRIRLRIRNISCYALVIFDGIVNKSLLRVLNTQFGIEISVSSYFWLFVSYFCFHLRFFASNSWIFICLVCLSKLCTGLDNSSV